MLILMALLALAPPAAANDIALTGSASVQTDRGRHAIAQRPLRDIVGPMDPGANLYPDEARKMGAEGTTTVALSLRAGETVPACRIETSSGSAALDAQSCALALSHQSFAASRTKRVVQQKWRWTLSADGQSRWPDAIAIEPESWVGPNDFPREAMRKRKGGVVEAEYVIDQQGAARDCKVTTNSGDVALGEATCDIVVRRARFLAARDQDGRPRATIGTWKTYWIVPRL